MSLRFSVSEYRPSDAPALEEFFPEFRDEIAPQLVRGAVFEGVALVARYLRRAIGFVFAKWYREPCYYDRGVSRYGEIEDLHVHPERQNQGVGTALVRRVLREAHRRGCRAVYLITDDVNAPARRVYAKCGLRQHNLVIRYKRSLWSPPAVLSGHF